MDPSHWGHAAAAPPLDPVGPIIFTQSQIEGCLLRGLSKWEIVAELQNSNQIKQSTTLDVWARLEQQNQPFFDAYDQFIKMRNQMQDFNDVIAKLFEDTNGSSREPGAAGQSSSGQGLNNNGQPAYISEGMEGKSNRVSSNRDDAAAAQQRLSPNFDAYSRPSSKAEDQ